MARITCKSGVFAGLVLLSGAMSLQAARVSAAEEAGADSATLLLSDPSIKTIHVHYGDLDPSRPEDAEELYTRIRTAAVEVCGQSDLRDQHRTLLVRKCRANAMENAVKQVNSQALSALHRQHMEHDRTG